MSEIFSMAKIGDPIYRAARDRVLEGNIVQLKARDDGSVEVIARFCNANFSSSETPFFPNIESAQNELARKLDKHIREFERQIEEFKHLHNQALHGNAPTFRYVKNRQVKIESGEGC